MFAALLEVSCLVLAWSTGGQGPPQPFPDKNLSSLETVSLSSVPARTGEWVQEYVILHISRVGKINASITKMSGQNFNKTAPLKG